MGEEVVLPWLKSLPLAPEFHPSLSEFQDPISYIFKIEQIASKYGICKIIPPFSPASKKTVISNLNKSLLSKNSNNDNQQQGTFTTRQQQVGFCVRKSSNRPVQKPVWQSGEVYTLSHFETKAKGFEKGYLKNKGKRVLSDLEIESLYWKAQVDKPITVEYANDMPGSAFEAFSGTGGRSVKGKRKEGEGVTVGETEWNMRGVSRSKGSLLKFMKEEIPGVTSPMVYISMLFSWFAWHVEDHDFHSLNYMHMGAGKTWYGVPRDAAVAFEDVVRVHGYGGEINPIVTFATLGEKTTIISPEVLVKAGVPCCRLVQNAGEFVVTFPRAYHSGFSHGFNCGEAANIATPGWLSVARDAAIRRASINVAPMVSHTQLLYDLAVSISSIEPISIKPKPRSSRLKDKLKVEGEALVKRLFLQDIMHNNQLLHTLGKGSSIVLLSEEYLDKRAPFSLSSKTQGLESKLSSDPNDANLDKKPMRTCSSFYSRNNGFSLIGGKDASASSLAFKDGEYNKKADPGVFSCVTCGILCYACVAIIQPTEAAANYLMSADSKGISDLVDANENASVADLKSSPGQMAKSTRDGLFNLPVKSFDQMQTIENSGVASLTSDQKVNSSLGLLALAYGDSSDSDDDDCDLARGDTKDTNYSRGSFENNESLKDVNCSRGNFEYGVESFSAHESQKAVQQIENMPMNSTCDEDSSRMHIFCLEHALEVEQRLRPVGGVSMLLLCHQDYPSLDFEARSASKELGTDHTWTDLEFRESDKQDKKWIQSALDNEEATHGNRDWAVKLGINLFYSASLSRSPLYSKQMPYNLVIYNAFGHISPSSNPSKPKPSGRQKKITVAGKWCGKVWMSSHAHPLLVRDDEEQAEISGPVLSDVKLERRFENAQVVINKYSRKRKKNVTESRRSSVKTKFPKVEPSQTPSPSPSPPPSPPVGAADMSLSGGFRRQPRTNLRKKQIGTERNIINYKTTQYDTDSEGETDGGSGGGPSLRLRKRITKPPSKDLVAVTESKPKRKPTQYDTDSEGESDGGSGGGSSLRLRKRITKPPSKDFVAVTESKPKRTPKRQNDTKKFKQSAVIKVNDEEEEQAEFVCDMEGCNMSFETKQDLIIHKRNICPVNGCGKKFFSHKYLVQHRRVHMDIRPLSCPWKGCKMTFKWAWARTEHIRVHTGARPYVCNEEGCGQTFRFVSDFSRHKRKTGHSVKK
ncbi:jmjC domain, JmjN domain, Zinc finger, C2H2-like protein [Artemisia annua]|uniref:JmjC domain, JmjN domain, Zinc finger, C2H2-like protein n=1 Tax=Artemisia annua TaxID=35608 RepID=A0A2U1LVM6_ARTAN|nr:jmjC domain, JmjN domain, Zinc finger, C2H2-like protein [Artemisia annua]